jgi:hypothetical protein
MDTIIESIIESIIDKNTPILDSLDNDTKNFIIKQIPILNRLQIYKILNEPRPTQFQVSSELIASKDLRGGNGLLMRAITTGELEPCIQSMLLSKKHMTPEQLTIYAEDIRYDFKNYDSNQLVERVKVSHML